MENEPGLYKRVKTDIDMEDGTKQKAWVYVAGNEMMQRSKSFEVIQSGDWYDR